MALRRLRRRRPARARSAQSLANRISKSMGVRPWAVHVQDCPKCPKGGWRGQYHPKSRSITQAMAPDMPKRLRPALTDHETGHGATREVYCKPKRRRLLRKLGHAVKCSYRGQHNGKFYKVTKKIHQMNGVGPKAACELETSSGYSPPLSWRIAARRGKW
jgi:hypothetical protein